MKKIFFFSIVVICISCKTKKMEDNVFYIKKNNSFEKFDLPNTSQGIAIAGIIDSLNSKDYKIPNAFDNLYLDYDYNKAYVTYGKAISTRRFIINRVINLHALKAIEFDSKYSKVPDSNFIKSNYSNFIFEMPYIEMSLKDLVRQRISELEN
jgi:hypothetical protein